MTSRTGIRLGSAPAGPGMAARPESNEPFRPVLRMSALDLAALDTAVPGARLHARHVACEWGHAVLAADCELVVAELVTNAVTAVRGLGGAAGPPPVRIRLTRHEDGVQAEVWDSSDDLPDPHRRRPPDAPGGWGLVLVNALSARWGTYRTSGGGTCVWAIIVHDQPARPNVP